MEQQKTFMIQVLGLMEVKSTKIRKIAAHVISLGAEKLGYYFFNDKEVMQALIECAVKHGDGPFADTMMKTVQHIFCEARRKSMTNITKAAFGQVVYQLHLFMMNLDRLQFITYYSNTLTDIIKEADIESVDQVAEELQRSLEAIQSVLDNRNLDEDSREMVLEHISSVVQVALNFVAVHKQSAFTQEFGDNVFKLAVQICQKMNRINMSALVIISALTHVPSVKLTSHYQMILDILKKGVESGEPQIMKECSRVVGDLANCLSENEASAI